VLVICRRDDALVAPGAVVVDVAWYWTSNLRM
jgi:hypothetical protein